MALRRSFRDRSAALLFRSVLFRSVLFWTVPPAMALLLYWPGLTCWFQKDDFAWLGLRDMVANWHDLGWALFAPLAQGTIRTFSERMFYMGFTSLFGIHPLPFRGWAFLTFALTLPLLSSVCARLTGSRAAGFWAAVLWTSNSVLAVALSWTAIYYELLCSFCFLLGFWFLLRYLETGESRFWAAQGIVFLFGFGVLELNVVYPALASVYALCCARRVLVKILPMFLVSGAYTVLHMKVAPMLSSGPYQMFWDASIFSTLWTYAKMALGPNRLMLIGVYPSRARSVLTVALLLGLLGFLFWKLFRRQWVVLFFPAWFVIVLAPLLPLRNHLSDYYLTIPLIGVAMWGGWALTSAWRSGIGARCAALSLLAIYFGVSFPVGRATAQSFHKHGAQVHSLISGVVEASRNQKGKLILLTGVDTDMFWDAVFHRPFRLFGLDQMYVAREDASKISGELTEDAQKFFADPAAVALALQQSRALVLDVRGGQVRDITAEYR